MGGSQGSQGSSLFGLLRAKSSQEGGAAGAGNSATFASEDCKALAAGLRKVRPEGGRPVCFAHLSRRMSKRNELTGHSSARRYCR